MLKRIEIITIAASVVALLSGCGGGGAASSGSAIDVPPGAFVGPSRTVTTGGVSATAAGTRTVSGNTTTINSGTPHGVNTASNSAQVSFNQNVQPSAATLTAPNSSASAAALTCRANGLCGAATGSPAAGSDLVVLDAAAHGWHYQTFGIWANRPTVSTWQTGAMSMGNATPGNAVPTSGSATFSGRAIGQYADANGTPFTTFSQMQANVNFGARSIGFSTSGTVLHRQSDGSETSNAGLNLSGTLTYSPGSSQFSGPVSTSNNQLSGQAGGRFYGPSAQEIGGAFSLNGSGPSHMVGGFGGSRQ
jgi:hypothetical protein